jgi:dTDP-4-dehydrorhamnose reductase
MLGDAFYKRFKNDYLLRCTDIDVNDEWLEYTDVRDYAAYRRDVWSFSPDYLIHLAALTDLEYCEDNPAEAYRTNTMGTENAVLIANELGLPLVYVSTAGIFGGEKTNYDDWDTPSPVNVYGRSKYMGERYVTENCNCALVCRAGWMMGGGGKDKKFVAKILKQINDGVKEIFAVSDREGTPTYTHDFALNVRLLLDAEFWGTYNMVCTGETSRLEVAREIVKILGVKVKVTEVNSGYFPEYYAPRPASEMLINTKLNIRGLNVMQDWQTALKQYLNER